METVMTISQLQNFFMWCSIINVAMLLISFLMMLCASDGIYKIHSKWFKISKEQFHAIWYQFLAFYKIGTILFCIVPYVALLIVG